MLRYHGGSAVFSQCAGGGESHKTAPVFEFYTEEGKVLGNTGCNDFNGAFSIVDYGIIQFGDMAVTRLLCDRSNAESSLIKSVFGRRMKYNRDGLLLTLEGYDGTRLLYKKVD